MKFKAFLKTKDNLAAAKEFAEEKNLAGDVIYEGGIKKAFDTLGEEDSLDYVLVELSSKDSSKAFEELDELANYVDPATKVVVCGTVDELSFYKELIGMGVHEYLLNPVKKDQLDKVTSRKAKESDDDSASIPAAREDSHVIAVCGTRGGSGASSLAVNLAGIFSKRGYPTAILDLDPEFGTIPLMVDVEASKGLVDAFEKPERVDSLFLDRVMTKVNDHLFVMGAEKNLLEMANIQDDAAMQIIRQLQSKFAYIIVDVARVEPYAHYVLQNYDTIITTELSISGLRDTMRIYDLVHEQLKNDNVKVIANRVGMGTKFETPLKDFEAGLGKKVDHSIPFEAEYYGFNDSGKILALEDIKKSKLLDAYNAIASEYMPDAVGAGSDDKKVKKSGGLSNFLSGKKK